MANVPPPKQSRKGAPPPPTQTVGNLEKPVPGELTPLNFKVPVEFHREFKAYAALRGISMVELLQEGFRLIKEHRTGSNEITKNILSLPSFPSTEITQVQKK